MIMVSVGCSLLTWHRHRFVQTFSSTNISLDKISLSNNPQEGEL